MAQNFRSAFNGFNRDDVVQYLEFIRNRHAAEINDLSSQVQFLRQKLENAPREDLSVELETLRAENEALRQQVQELTSELEQRPVPVSEAPSDPVPQQFRAEQELEAYRRAERTERLARERAEQIFRQTNGVLADATAKVDDASAQIGAIVEQVRQQMDMLQYAVGTSRQALQEAAATMYSMNPAEAEK